MKKIIFTGLICLVAVAIIHAQSAIGGGKLPKKMTKFNHLVLPSGLTLASAKSF